MMEAYTEAHSSLLTLDSDPLAVLVSVALLRTGNPHPYNAMLSPPCTAASTSSFALMMRPTRKYRRGTPRVFVQSMPRFTMQERDCYRDKWRIRWDGVVNVVGAKRWMYLLNEQGWRWRREASKAGDGRERPISATIARAETLLGLEDRSP